MWTTHDAEPAVRRPQSAEWLGPSPTGTYQRVQRVNSMRTLSGRCSEGPVEELAGSQHRIHGDGEVPGHS